MRPGRWEDGVTGGEPRLLLRDHDPGQGSPHQDLEEKEETLSDFNEAVLCRQCGHTITERKNACEVNGSHGHTFFNPAGIVFQIGCFTGAPGCILHGPASREFSWFAGYSWRLALCYNCTTHLGWFFSSSNHSFLGLIFNRLSQ